MLLYPSRIDAYLTPSSLGWGLAEDVPKRVRHFILLALALAGYLKRLRYMRLQSVEKHPYGGMAGQEESQHFPNAKVCVVPPLLLLG